MRKEIDEKKLLKSIKEMRLVAIKEIHILGEDIFFLATDLERREREEKFNGFHPYPIL